MKGKKHSKETLKKLSEIHKNKQTGEENPMAKLTKEHVATIRQKYKTRQYIQKQLAEEYNISTMSINRIVNNITWKNIEE